MIHCFTLMFVLLNKGCFSLISSKLSRFRTKNLSNYKMASFSIKPAFSWQQTMLRIKDPKVTVPFYEKNFGFKLIHTYHFEQWNFSLYFLAILPKNVEVELPTPGTKESAKFLWTMPYTCLELTHNHGSENDPNFSVRVCMMFCVFTIY